MQDTQTLPLMSLEDRVLSQAILTLLELGRASASQLEESLSQCWGDFGDGSPGWVFLFSERDELAKLSARNRGGYLSGVRSYFSWHLQHSRLDPDSRLQRQMLGLQQLLHLSPDEAAILTLFVCAELDERLGRVLRQNSINYSASTVLTEPRYCARYVERWSGAETASQNPPGPVARLIAYGALAQTCSDSEVHLNNSLLRALRAEVDQVEAFRQYLGGRPAVPELDWADFEHLQPDRELIARLLDAAVQERVAPFNLLFHGAPGTGKTQFAKRLGQHLGLDVYMVGESTSNGEEPDRAARIADLRLKQSVLRSQPRSLLVVDEADDIFTSSSISAVFSGYRGGHSKVYLNRLLETGRLPVVWIVNDLEQVDRHLIRRMSDVQPFRMAPRRARTRQWQAILAREQLTGPDYCPERLAARHATEPALMNNAARMTRLGRGSAAELHQLLERMQRAMGQRSQTLQAPTQSLRTDLLNCPLDLARLEESLRGGRPQGLSFLLHGPSGCGKSQYALHLAEVLGLEPAWKQPSDFFARYVGETERNLARAFEQAADLGQLLILDEADALLQSRSRAQAHWETVQVNELLMLMERHPLPWVCATNHIERLDRACLRRFRYKLKLDYLRPGQYAETFRHFFAVEAPAQLAQLHRLTLGDFHNVREQAQCQVPAPDAAWLCEQLRAETLVREGAGAQIGFLPGSAPLAWLERK